MSKHLMYVVAVALSVAVAACATTGGAGEWQGQFAERKSQGDDEYIMGDNYDRSAAGWEFNGDLVQAYRDLAEAQRWFARAAETYPPGHSRERAIQARDRVARQLASNRPVISRPTAVTPPAPVISRPTAVTPPTPAPVASAAPRSEEIPLVKAGGVYELSVEINGVLKLPFVLDSGAAEVNMPADVVMTLLRTGTIKETDFLPGATYVLADGSKLKSPRFMIRSLKIGQHSITNVSASVGNVPSTPLLGQSLLAKLGTWGIDNQRQVLIIHPGRP